MSGKGILEQYGNKFISPDLSDNLGGSFSGQYEPYGKQNIQDSPVELPKLDRHAYRFLVKIVDIAYELEESLALIMTPPSDETLYIPESVRKLIDIMESIVSVRPEEDGLHSVRMQPVRPYVFASKQDKRYREVVLIDHDDTNMPIRQYRIPVSIDDKQEGSETKDELFFLKIVPERSQTYYSSGKKRILGIQDMRRDDAQVSLAYAGMDPLKVLEILDGAIVENPSIEIANGKALFRAEIVGDMIRFGLSIEDDSFERGEKMEDPQRTSKIASLEYPAQDLLGRSRSFGPLIGAILWSMEYKRKKSLNSRY